MHLNEHIAEGRSVACPVTGCHSAFTLKSSFKAHMSRNHRECSVNNISDAFKENTPQSPLTTHEDSFNSSGLDGADENTDLPPNFSEIFLRNVCLLYLKLQGELLIPASTIQVIVEEMQNVHEIGLDYTLSKLQLLLKNDLNLTDDAVSKICDCVKESDLFSGSHKGPLRTTYSRAQTFHSMFKYVQPKRISLGNDENMLQRFAYYVPVQQTLTSLLESELWNNSVLPRSCETDPCVFSDISDGQVFKTNQFLIDNPECLNLILYQDAFEIVNPLGSAKKKHKVLAVYFSVANLPVHVRSNTDHMSLVLLCIENDFKRFGSASVFSDMLSDLKDLEINGITVGAETVKAALFCIAGDNLGSHNIGGFTENFSTSKYFCRYCEVTKGEFLINPNVCGQQRNPDNYNSAVADLTEDRPIVRGIKLNSDFNGLQAFHVCQPGLPPGLRVSYPMMFPSS